VTSTRPRGRPVHEQLLAAALHWPADAPCRLRRRAGLIQNRVWAPKMTDHLRRRNRPVRRPRGRGLAGPERRHGLPITTNPLVLLFFACHPAASQAPPPVRPSIALTLPRGSGPASRRRIANGVECRNSRCANGFSRAKQRHPDLPPCRSRMPTGVDRAQRVRSVAATCCTWCVNEGYH